MTSIRRKIRTLSSLTIKLHEAEERKKKLESELKGLPESVRFMKKWLLDDRVSLRRSQSRLVTLPREIEASRKQIANLQETFRRTESTLLGAGEVKNS